MRIEPDRCRETNYYWKGPWERGQRCILSVGGFFEPHKFEDGRKEPFYVHLVDREVFGVAGIWDRSVTAEGMEVLSCTLITTAPNDLMARIHNEKLRMPAVLREEDHEAWLKGSPADAMATLRSPYPSDLMVAWQVRRYVNTGSDDARQIEPVDRVSS